jgi:hypothetical protein
MWTGMDLYYFSRGVVAAATVVATMASIWWFALRPRRKIKLDK